MITTIFERASYSEPCDNDTIDSERNPVNAMLLVKNFRCGLPPTEIVKYPRRPFRRGLTL